MGAEGSVPQGHQEDEIEMGMRAGRGRGHEAKRHALPERVEVCPTSTHEAERREGDEMTERVESDAYIASELLT